MDSAVALLSRVGPLQGLPEGSLDSLARWAEEADVGEGQVVDDGAGPSPYLYVVRTGAVRLDAGEDRVRVVARGGVFGWRAVRGPEGPAERATAAQPTALIRIHGSKVLDVLASAPGGAVVLDALTTALGSESPIGARPLDLVEPSRPTSALRRALTATTGSALERAGEWVRSPRPYWAVLGYVLFLGFWYLAVEVLALPRFAKLPGLTQVAREWSSRNPTFGLSIYTPVYYQHIWVSLRRVGVAFSMATTLGVSVGLLLGGSTTFREYVFPVFELVRPIPILAWVPLAIILFPGSEAPVVYLTFLASFFATTLNTLLGVRSIDPQYVLAARCLGASRWQVFRHVIAPGALPFIFTGLQISIGVAWFSLAAAEMVSGQFGLGYVINTSYTMVQYPTIVIGMMTLGLVGFMTSALVRLAGERLMSWRSRELAVKGA